MLSVFNAVSLILVPFMLSVIMLSVVAPHARRVRDKKRKIRF